MAAKARWAPEAQFKASLSPNDESTYSWQGKRPLCCESRLGEAETRPEYSTHSAPHSSLALTLNTVMSHSSCDGSSHEEVGSRSAMFLRSHAAAESTSTALYALSRTTTPSSPISTAP